VTESKGGEAAAVPRETPGKTKWNCRRPHVSMLGTHFKAIGAVEGAALVSFQ